MKSFVETKPYYTGSSFWTVFFAIALFFFDQGIAITFKSILIITGCSLFLGFLFGRVCIIMFDFYIVSNHPYETIPKNLETITSARTTIRVVSIVLIFLIVFSTLKLFFT
jgi:hypothetical protein